MKFVKYLSLLFIAAYVSCSPIKKPKVSFKDVRVESIGFEEIGLALRFDVENPNPFGGEISSMQYTVFIEDDGNDLRFLESKSDKGAKIEAKSTTTISLPIVLNYNEVGKILKSSQDQDRVNYRVKGEVSLKTMVGNVGVPFEKSGDFPVFRKPGLSLANFKMKQTLTRTKVNFDVVIENKNTFLVGLKDFKYSVKLWGEPVVEGSGEDVEIKPGGEAVLPMKASFNLAKLGGLLLKGFSEQNLDYQVEVDGVLSNDWKDFDFNLVKKNE